MPDTLFMADKTCIFLRLNTRASVDRFCTGENDSRGFFKLTIDLAFRTGFRSEGGTQCMTVGAVVHFHAIPGILLEPAYILSPDVPAVSGDPIFLVNPGFGGLTDVAVACDTVHFGHFDMRGMGEKYTLGLL
jgi:hypothetical protein